MSKCKLILKQYFQYLNLLIMVTKNECPDTIAGKADQINYIAPEVTVLELSLEKGFAGSNGTDDWSPESW